MDDARTLGLIIGVVVVLGIASAIAHVLKRRVEYGIDPAIIETFRSRIRAWWLLFACLAGAFLVGQTATIVLFGLLSFWALREFITLTPTRPADHRTLFWVFFLCTPLQFILVGLDSSTLHAVLGIGNYALFSIVIPVYAALIVPIRIAVSGDPKRFLERTAKIQTGLLICVYCLSYAPALLTLDLSMRRAFVQAAAEATDSPSDGDEQPADAPVAAEPETPHDAATADTSTANDQPQQASSSGDLPAPPAGLTEADRLRLLFFLVLIVQLSDAFQYAWSQLPSKHFVAPTINASRTWEGVLGGALTAALFGGLLWWATPFPHWWQAVLISGLVSLIGFGGTLTMSAIKRDRGVTDYGTLVEGHSGVLDRIDSLCFAAPLFYHFTYMFAQM